jgi:hypothetical protein
MSDPNVAILNRAWSLLWKPGSSYYLKDILTKGGTFGNTHIPSLATVTVPDIGSLPLYTSDTWGNVSIKLTGATLAGLPEVQNKAFTPSSDGRSVTATVAFTNLTFAGSYEVDGTGAAGCAMDVAESQAYSVPVTGEDRAAGATPPAGNMTLARAYRDRLVTSGNGAILVGKYYDHNDAVNWILSQDNAFTEAWPSGVPGAPHNTAYYMQMTANAAANPGDQDYTVGGSDSGYQQHGAYMQVMLIATCHHYENDKNTDPAHAAACKALAADAATFQGYTNKYPDPMTVNQVMTEVQNTAPMSAEELARVPEPEAVRQARLAAERDFPHLQRAAHAKRAAREAQVTTYKSTGNFSFGFAMPTLSFSGTVTASGIQPNLTLTVTLTKLSADIPNVAIQFLSSTDPTFAADAQSYVDDAQWFQKVLGTGVNSRLGSPDVLSYLSQVVNQAITSIISG